jgi:hypothetical protein
MNGVTRNVTRRLERLEARAAVTAKAWIHSVRILLVDPQDGCTGVIVIETGKPDLHVDPTPEESNRFAPTWRSTEQERANYLTISALERSRSGRRFACDNRGLVG